MQNIFSVIAVLPAVALGYTLAERRGGGGYMAAGIGGVTPVNSPKFKKTILKNPPKTKKANLQKYVDNKINLVYSDYTQEVCQLCRSTRQYEK